MSRVCGTAVLLAISVAMAATAARAQNIDSIRQSYLLPVPRTFTAPTGWRYTPGASVQSPTAYAMEWGEGYLGAGYQNRMRYTGDLPRSKRMDGAVFAAFGFGDAEKYVGLEAVATSFSTVRSGFGNHSSLSFKIHRALPRNFAVAAGWEDAIRTRGTDGGTSLYAVTSTSIDRFTVTAGVGGGRFKTEKSIDLDRTQVSVIGSVGYRLFKPVSLIADWAGQDLALGASIVPLRRVPIYIMPGLADVTGSAGDGARFILGVGFGFTYKQLDNIFGTH